MTTEGRAFPFRAETADRLTVLFFGFTSCPDVCPLVLHTLARSLERLDGTIDPEPLVTFVGVDLGRDTPEALEAYLGRVDPTFIGLTGSAEAVGDANRLVQNPPVQIVEQDDGTVDVQHGSRVLVFPPDGPARRIYRADTRQQTFVADLPRIAQGHWR